MPPETEAQIAHHIPGRLRLTVPGLRGAPELAERLSRELGAIEEVVEVTVRPAARSVLVRYEPNGRDGIVAALGAVVAIQEASPDRVERQRSGGTIGEAAAAWTHGRWDRIDQGLMRASDGAVDLATVIPLALLLVAVHQVLTQASLAAIPWYTVLYYAHQSFYHYYRKQATSERDARPQPDEEEKMGPE
jgi:hypothetical protein